jgi:hypothetical protein
LKEEVVIIRKEILFEIKKFNNKFLNLFISNLVSGDLGRLLALCRLKASSIKD